RLIGYRAEHGLSQTTLAERLGMKQPAIARLEAGEKNPTWDTLARISETLRIEFVIDIVPSGARATIDTDHVGKAEIVERVTAGSHSVVVAVR
ncbi:MAG: helix-turn-helix domain-containing protein, partial [Actinomycetota bacterium]